MTLLLSLLNMTAMGERDHSEVLAQFGASGQQFTTDRLKTGDGHDLEIIFFSHASLAFVWDGMVVYVDPLTEYADHSLLPKADLVLVTHEHYDHLDAQAIDALRTDATVVIGSAEVARQYSAARAMRPGDSLKPAPGVTVEAVPAYNVSEHQLQFHPRERGDNGYILSLGETRIYVSGDTEPTPEMGGFGRVDIMFLPVNQPYTMTLDQAAAAARTIGAPLFYPYHTGDTEIERLRGMLADTPSITVKIHPME